MFISHQENAGQNHKIRIANKSIENVAELKIENSNTSELHS
jgi:hypothetical protein